jgi:hypothetical protein
VLEEIVTVSAARLKRFASSLAGKMRKRDLSTAKEATAPTEVDRPGALGCHG